MSLHWSHGMRRWIRRTRRRLSSRRFVLAYHRVAEPAHDPWNLAVTPQHFDEQLQALRAFGAVLPLGRMLSELDAGTLPSRAVAVTFDDGYADTLLAAHSLLDRNDIPATVFLCPGLLDGRTSFWWDALARIVFAPASLPRHLGIEMRDELFSWSGPDGDAGSGGPSQPDPSAGGEEISRFSKRLRQNLHMDLWRRLREMEREEQRIALRRLASWAGLDGPDDPTARPMSRSEAERLAADGLVEIGAHTLTHAHLPTCSDERQKVEIENGKALCEEIAGARVNAFSYPHGAHAPGARRLLRQAGFTSAWTTAPDALTRSTDRLLLPRVPALDWDGAALERCLATADFT